ncbi:MAG: AMP-binding protein [Eubacteriales bacterium]|nr:AMP-binding protein [Eubacteriales bacterium]
MQIFKGKPYFPVRHFSTIREMILQSVERYGDRTAFRYRETVNGPILARTYTQFEQNIQQLGTALMAIGLGTGRLAVIGENSYAWCVAHATVVGGVGVVVPLDRLLPADEIFQLLERGEVDAVLYDPAFHDTLQSSAAKLPRLKALICLRPYLFPDQTVPTWIEPKRDLTATKPVGSSHLLTIDSLLAFGQELLQSGDFTYSDAPIDPTVLMSLLFTSGTTSAAKAVMLSQHNICTEVQAVASVVKLWPGIRMLSVLPLHHTFENTCGLYMGLYYGAEIHECDGLRYIQKNLQEYHIDMLIGVPALFENFYTKVWDTLRKSGKDALIKKMLPITDGLRKVGVDLRPIIYKQILAAFGGRLKVGICGAAPIKPEIIEFFDSVGFRILQGYGLTETSPVVAGCNSKIFVPGTVGHPVGSTEIAIDTETPGEPGEILVRGPIVMLGYYKDAAATDEVIDPDGWFHTGDIGQINPKNNCLTITGRQKSMIVLKSGKKVFPEEIEYLLSQDEFVKESLVWGETDKDGEVVISAKMVIDKAALSQKHGQEVDDQTVQQHIEKLLKEINSKLPTFKGVRHYVFSFQEMVKTTTLKIRRPIEIAKLRDWMAHHKLRLRDITGRNVDQDSNDAVQDEKGKGEE